MPTKSGEGFKDNGRVINLKLDTIATSNKEVESAIKEMHREIVIAIKDQTHKTSELLNKVFMKQEMQQKDVESNKQLLRSIKSKLNVNIYVLIPIIASLITIIISILTLSKQP